MPIELPASARVNFVGFACGVKGSGKSTLVNKWASHFPRRIVIDFMAELFGQIPGAYECLTLEETTDALADIIHEKKTSAFTVVSCITPEEVPTLCNILAPLKNPRGGYSLGVDGLLLDCAECELIWPNDGSMSDEAGNLIHRGRHYRISVAAATRRTRDVNRLLTSQADVVACFRQQETRDLQYLAGFLGENVAAKVATLPEFSYVQKLPSTGRASVIDKDGKEIVIADAL
jgi:hypothetical protein